MADAKILQEVEALEERLQVVKWTIGAIRPSRRWSRSVPSQGSIVSRTAGSLGRQFPSGVQHEQRIRKSWGKRRHRLGL